MATIDWVIIILLALGAVSGFMKGFFKQLAAVVGLIAGLLVARALFAGLGEQLAVAVGTSVTFGQILAFLKYALVISLVIHFIDFADSKDNLIHSTTKGSSLLYYPIKDFSAFFYPVVKTVTEKFIETDNIQN